MTARRFLLIYPRNFRTSNGRSRRRSDLGDPAGVEGACRLVDLISVGDLNAKTVLPRAAALARKIGDQLAEIRCLAASAELAFFRQENDNAISGFQMTLDLCRALEDRFGEGECLLRLGELEARFDRYEAAGHLTLQALDAVKSCEGPLAVRGRATCHHNLAVFALRCGVARTSAEQARIALILFRSVGNLNGEAKCAMLAGMIFHELYDYENMQASFKEAISIFESGSVSQYLSRSA